MKKYLRRLSIAALTILMTITLFNCKKDKVEKKSDPEASLESFFQNNKKESQVFTVNASAPTTINGADGSQLDIPADAFVTSDGQTVTGFVTVELIEIFEKADMVLSEKPTVSNGEILISAGELFVNATQGSLQLQLAPGVSISTSLPADTITGGMTLFTASNTNGQFNWNQIGNGGMNGNDSLVISTVAPYKYLFEIGQLGWINCDKFYYDPNPKTNINITFTNNPSLAKTAVFLVFKDINSVIRVYNNNGNFTTHNIPTGMNITLVAFSIHEGKNYFVAKDIVVASGHSEELTLSELSEADMIAQIKNL
jgi:hypothetical protein